MSMSSSAASIASRGLLALPGYEPKHQPDQTIREFLAGSAAALGRSDISHPLKVSSHSAAERSNEPLPASALRPVAVCSC